MPPSPVAAPAAGLAKRLASWHRLAVVLLLGFASGLPLALTGQAMQAWLSMEGLDVATIGFLSLVGLPYTFKFLWAPLMDRFELPLLGRRRGWLVLTQLALAGVLMAMAATSPTQATRGLRAAGGGGGLRLGVAGRGHRRLPHRPAECRRTRPGLVAERAGLPAGDDRLRRHRADLDRPQPGRRLELERGLPLHGRPDGGGGRAVGAGAAAPAGRRGTAQRGAQRPARLHRRARRGGGRRAVHRPRGSRRWRVRCSCRRRNGPTCWRCWWASPSRCRWPPGRRAARSSRRCCRACRATSRSPARPPSCCSSCSTSSATPSPAR